MPDLTAFLLARISEDEEQAREDQPFAGPEGFAWYVRRMLADSEAKRRIIDLWDSANREASMGAEWPVKQFFDGRLSIIEAAIRMMVPVYADHPDFDASWRVE